MLNIKQNFKNIPEIKRQVDVFVSFLVGLLTKYIYIIPVLILIALLYTNFGKIIISVWTISDALFGTGLFWAIFMLGYGHGKGRKN